MDYTNHKKYMELSKHKNPIDFITGFFEMRGIAATTNLCQYILSRHHAHKCAIDAASYAMDIFELEI